MVFNGVLMVFFDGFLMVFLMVFNGVHTVFYGVCVKILK